MHINLTINQLHFIYIYCTQHLQVSAIYSGHLQGVWTTWNAWPLKMGPICPSETSIKLKVKFILEQATKAHKGRRGMAVLSL
jgi:hypothetical protein